MTTRRIKATVVNLEQAVPVSGGSDYLMISESAAQGMLVNLENRIGELESDAFGADLSYVDPITMQRGLLRTTANTYRVATAGNYRLPLVYGNGIKKGAANPAAYTRKESDYTAEFVNHLGNTITSPYIEDNDGCAVASVGLLWQTGSGLISSVSLYKGTDCRYLAFTVASIPTTNGLAVLWAKDADGNIVWSWTIWLTADNLAFGTIKNHTEVEYQMLPEALGAIWNNDRTKYCAPHYQWGRKDPMCPPAAYNSNSDMTLYDIDGNAYTGYGNYGVADDSDGGGTVRSVANSIRMPEKFFLEYDATKYNWNNLAWFNNFWNANETAISSLADDQDVAIKTIYDPSLPGMMLPAGRFATGFTTTGDNASTAAQFNVVGSFDNGWKFKADAEDIVGIYYPAAGCRLRTSGALISVGSNGYFWTFAPLSQALARYLNFDSGLVYPLNNRYRANGFAVRSAREIN